MPKSEREIDEELYASLTPEQRDELDRIARGESVGGVEIDLDAIEEILGDPAHREVFFERIRKELAKKP